MKKTIYFHIGLGKTGTTSIQKFLNINYEELYKRSILYPQTGLINNGHHDLATLGEDNFSLNTKELYAKLLIEIDKSSCSKVIISSENFTYMKEKYIEDIYDTFKDHNIYIVVYVREQVKLIESTYLEWLKTGKDYNGNIEDFSNLHQNAFDFMIRVEKWVKIFGKKSILARLFHKNVINNDITIDFQNFLNLGSKLKTLERFENESLLPDFANLVYEIEKQNINKEDRLKLITELLYLSGKLKKCSQKKLISVKLKDKILKRYENSNAEFANLFLNKEESNLLFNKKV